MDEADCLRIFLTRNAL